MKTLSASALRPGRRFVSHSLALERLTLVWSIFRVILFVLTGFHLMTLPAKAQQPANGKPLVPHCAGYNIVGRVVSAENPAEGISARRVVLHGADIGATTDKDGYYVFMNVMNGKYAVEALTPEGTETGATRTIAIRGNDVHVPALAVEEPQYVICGRVSYAHDRSRGLANVRISLGSGLTTLTDSLGYYAVENVRYNGTYTITATVPAKAHGLTVFGATRTVKIAKNLTRQNFIVESPAMAGNTNDNGDDKDTSSVVIQTISQQNAPQGEIVIGLPKAQSTLVRTHAQK